MAVDTLIIALFLLGIGAAWLAGRRDPVWMPVVTIAVTLGLGLRGLFLFEREPGGMAGIYGVLFVVGLAAIRHGLKRVKGGRDA